MGERKLDGFDFVPPPEAPVFHPNETEFEDPLTYIEKLRPVGELTGIIKIIPPSHWQPPFALDVDRLRFTPRVQRLNELEARTRVKLNFLDRVAKFWEMHDCCFKVPTVERKILDLHSLYEIVKEEGGFVKACSGRKWTKVSVRMGFAREKCLGNVLKHHYERLLYAYETFCDGPVLGGWGPEGEAFNRADPNGWKRSFQESENDMGAEKKSGVKEEAKPEIYKRSFGKLGRVGNRRSFGKNRRLDNEEVLESSENLGSFDKAIKLKKDLSGGAKSPRETLDTFTDKGLVCMGCKRTSGTISVVPCQKSPRTKSWLCPSCLSARVKSSEGFGFDQSEKEYSLQEFGAMADNFKRDYFNQQPHLVPSSLIEKEYWKIVSLVEEEVVVEYGADLHTMDHGSGFPTKDSLNLFPADQKYVKSGWNLTNLPVLEKSVLRYINGEISGITVPWMYVGMCFSTFCWHNEDHWTYSINYLHWGEAKTWYGVPGSQADLFEEVMRAAAPELFENQSDLLHQLVTTLNPNVLMKSGVSVYRCDQRAGEFVVTFPRAYHSGLNQGYNYAEAVNFALADWLQIGRECVLHYSELKRFCVFSHDELICKIASSCDYLNGPILEATYHDVLAMVRMEKNLRKALLDYGITKSERVKFELFQDEERQCEVCKTTCFMSSLVCSCSKDSSVCLRHYRFSCGCPPGLKTLRFRYTFDELFVVLKRLKSRLKS